MTYGILASQSCLLTEIADSLLESSRKDNVVNRLSSHLKKGVSDVSWNNYRQLIKRRVPSEPVIHIDDADVVKPTRFKFEALELFVTVPKVHLQKAYTKKLPCYRSLCNDRKQASGKPLFPYSFLFGKGYKSANSITFSAIETGAELFKNAPDVVS